MESVLRPEVIGPFMALAIPIVAIVGAYVYKIKKLEVERDKNADGSGQQVFQEILGELKRLRSDNAELRNRLEQVERTTPAASSDEDLLQQQRRLEQS